MLASKTCQSAMELNNLIPKDLLLDEQDGQNFDYVDEPEADEETELAKVFKEFSKENKEFIPRQPKARYSDSSLTPNRPGFNISLNSPRFQNCYNPGCNCLVNQVNNNPNMYNQMYCNTQNRNNFYYWQQNQNINCPPCFDYSMCSNNNINMNGMNPNANNVNLNIRNGLNNLNINNINNMNNMNNMNININNNINTCNNTKNNFNFPTKCQIKIPRKSGSSQNLSKQSLLKGPKSKKSNSSLSETQSNGSNSPTQSSQSTTGKKQKKKTSLFQNDPSRPEKNLRDFQRFCDGLKCQLPDYSCQQVGSRIMQKYLSLFPPEIRTILIFKIKNSFKTIMVDVYGNYFCQKLFQICTTEQRILILENITSDFVDIAKDDSGTYVIQTVLDKLDSETEKSIVLSCIKGHEMELAFSPNGTHVFQKILTVFPEDQREEVNKVIFTEENIKKLCLDSKGICVLKKLIPTTKNEANRDILINVIYKNCIQISENPYGNYVIQFLFDEWGLEQCSTLTKFCIEKSFILSVQRFSSNIVDKLITMLQKEENDERLQRMKEVLFDIRHVKDVSANKYGKIILSKLSKENENENENESEV